MKPDLWMPLYIGDYLKDTLGLSRSEHGSYMLLIMAYWSQQKPLPDDEQMLREIARCPETDWARCRGLMLRFFTIQDGMWHHKRIDAELKKASEMFSAKSKAGAVGAAARWQKDGNRNAVANGEGNAVAMGTPLANGWQTDAPSPSPSPSPLPSQAPSNKNDKASATKLDEFQKGLADEIEKLLGEQWVNDAGKWVSRIKENRKKMTRLIAEVNHAKRENRIKTTPAQYAEQIWKEFK